MTVTTDRCADSGLSTANDEVSLSNAAASACPVSGRTEPSGVPGAGGDTAASAGAMVGGGVSTGFDEHPDTTIATAKVKPTTRRVLFTRKG